MMARGAILAVAALLPLAVGAVPGHAQARQPAKPCEIVVTRVVRGADTTRLRLVTNAMGERDTYVGGGVDATCEGQGNRLLADSAEHFPDRGLMILYHNVRYSEERVTLDSDKMFYFTREERLVAEGNVKGKTANGSRFAGPQMEYFREIPGFREESSWIATGRPFMRMSPSENGVAPGTSTDSVDLTANRIFSRNDSLVWASGRVIIERSDIVATSDSATLDNGTEFARLLRQPRIVGKGEKAFTLVGTEIDMYSRERQLERVVAAGNGRATSDSLVLTADTIDMRIREQRMERVFTWGGRSRAENDGQDIEADSMDIRLPEQRLEYLHAVGRAVAYSAVDTAKVRSTERDWIAGDTLLASFETVQDSVTQGEKTRLREVVANGSARAFYQLAPSGSETTGPPNLSYNRGKTITVQFAAGEMSTVTVSERASGLYLEPATAPEAKPAAGGARRP